MVSSEFGRSSPSPASSQSSDLASPSHAGAGVWAILAAPSAPTTALSSLSDPRPPDLSVLAAWPSTRPSPATSTDAAAAAAAAEPFSMLPTLRTLADSWLSTTFSTSAGLDGGGVRPGPDTSPRENATTYDQERDSVSWETGTSSSGRQLHGVTTAAWKVLQDVTSKTTTWTTMGTSSHSSALSRTTVPITTTTDFAVFNSTLADMLSNHSQSNDVDLNELKHPVLGVMLAFFCLVVIVGNVMVIVAVFKELYLRSVTNYFIVSLAVADVMVGGVVMPFAISHEMTNEVWLYGQEWCDLWHSLDVLASTASILNLCIISLDRYWAITDPINYPTRMSTCKVCLLITLVWLCSAGISFPAIAWWKDVAPPDKQADQCRFTEDSAYLIVSSLISFYIPTFIMMFVYAKIYRAAAAQSEGIKAGSKITSNGLRGDDGEVMTLRIHRGGMRSSPNECHLHHHPHNYHHHHHTHSHHHHHHHPSNGGGRGGGGGCGGGCGGMDCGGSNNNGSGGSGGGGGGGGQSGGSMGDDPIQFERSTSDSEGDLPCPSVSGGARLPASSSDRDSGGGTPRPAKHITKRLRHFALSKKLTKLAREQKAAKTLGIVVGVFIMCWLPFFVTNILLALCGGDCIANPKVLFPVVTWLGYINSGMNPIIYALSMRDFRRAFSKMICCCCPRYLYQNPYLRPYQHHHNSLSTSSFTAACGDKCATLKM